MSKEEGQSNQEDAAEAPREDHKGAEGLETKLTENSQDKKAENNRTAMPVLE
jgi:hypothetical protein